MSFCDKSKTTRAAEKVTVGGQCENVDIDIKMYEEYYQVVISTEGTVVSAGKGLQEDHYIQRDNTE